MAVVIPILLILVVAAVSVVVIAGRVRSSSTGALSRETRRRDQDTAAQEPEAVSTSTELEATGRERADDTRSTLGGVPARRRGGAVVEYEPVDEEVIAVTRRQFLNRGVLIAVGFAAAGFAPAMLAFLWPLRGQGGFGDPVNIGNLDVIFGFIDANRKPFYAPEARTYIERFPNDNQSALNLAKAIYKPPVYENMEKHGFIPLYQRCPHLGCRVPFCETSQWFECPCHGSKYNKVGEKTAGPAPRGMDAFLADVSGSGSVTIQTGTIYNGTPIGTNTTKQQPEGPLCV